MDLKYCVGMGVEVNKKYINFCCLNGDGNFIKDIQLLSPNPLMPGAVIIQLCEFVGKYLNFKRVKYVGLCLPGIIDPKARSIKQCMTLSGWNDIPMADWLEVQLQSKVFVGNSNECEIFGSSYSGYFSGSIAAVGVGRLAHKKYVGTIDPFKGQ